MDTKIKSFYRIITYIVILLSSCSPWFVEFDTKALHTIKCEESKDCITIQVDSVHVEDRYRIRKNDIKWTREMVDSAGIRAYAEYDKRWLQSKHFRNKIAINRFKIFIEDTTFAEISRILETDSTYKIHFLLKKNGHTKLLAISEDLGDTCYSPIWVKNNEIFTIRP